MQRISVIGITGSGKTTIGERLGRLLDLPHYDLDMLYFEPRWRPRGREEFDAMVADISAGERWVIDGSYQEWTVEGPIWQRADTVVWPRLSRMRTMRQLLGRTLHRLLTRQVLKNGNREELRMLLNPMDSIITDVWTRHRRYNREFDRFIRDPRFSHIEFVVLRSRDEVDRWLDAVAAIRSQDPVAV